jgi:hypothetical protein
MRKRKQSDDWPFTVFAEAVPQAARLADPKVSQQEKDRIRRDANTSIDVAKTHYQRNTQKGRHGENHEKRARVMIELRCAQNGKPERGEPSRLAQRHHVSVKQVRKWIEQLRELASKGTGELPDDWRTVYVGEGIRHKYRLAGRLRHKPKN